MAVAPPNPPYVGPLPHVGSSTNKPLKRIVIHCTAGAEPGLPGAARGTVRYTRSHPEVWSSYHYAADSKESVQAVYDSVIAYHCGTNSNSIGYELSCSLSNSGRDHWKQPDHQAMLRIAADDVARLCLAYDVPIRKLSVVDLEAGAKGICGHVDMRDAFGNTTHWDPGPFFPWPDFIRLVQAAADKLAPPPAPPPLPPPVKKTPVHLCIAGDWNEGPASTGMHSPSWIAAKGGLNLPANFKGIDYPMTSAKLSDVRRVKGGGSDHDLVAFTVTHEDGRTLKGATWNVQRDRPLQRRLAMVDFIVKTADEQDLDFLCLQEIRQYHDDLSVLEGWAFVGGTSPDGVEHNGILVRAGLKQEKPRLRLTSKVGWFTITGAAHDPSSAALVTIAGWLRVASVHEAPTVDWRSGKPVGPVRRVAVRAASARTLARIARRHRAGR